MLYLAIDQHKAQLTVNLRNEQGDVVFKVQISTKHSCIDDFFDNLAKRSARHRGFMAILEVCGLNPWLLETLRKYRCREIVVIQPENYSSLKTDQRDANALGELLWNNRKRLVDGQRPNGIRRIFPPNADDAKARQLSNFRHYLVTQKTRIINKVKGLLAKHNKEQEAPTQSFTTKKYRQWLTEVSLPDVDRLEMNIHLEFWSAYEKRIVEVEVELARRSENNPNLFRLVAIPGISVKGGIAILSRIGDIKRFKTPGSLANYFGLTPGCHNSGNVTQRLGGITKSGSKLARHVLNFAVPHIVQKDPMMKRWHRKIKNRRGAKTALGGGCLSQATVLPLLRPPPNVISTEGRNLTLAPKAGIPALTRG